MSLVMKEKIERAIHGFDCPRCGNDYFYRLKDDRFKCSHCQFRYNYRKENLFNFLINIPFSPVFN